MRLDALGWTAVVLLATGTSSAAWFSIRSKGPVHRWLEDYLAALEREMRALFLQLTPRSIVALQGIAILATAAAAISSHDIQFLALIPVFALGPRIAFHFLRKQRARRIEEQLNGWLAMMANILKVTGSLTDAFRQSVDLLRGPLAQELDFMLKELKMGLPLADGLRNLATRINSDVLSIVVTVIIIGRNTGGELPTLLAETAATLRERMRLEGVVRKETAGSRSQLVVLVLAPPVIIYMFTQVEKGYFDPLFDSLIGQLLGAAALLMYVGSIWWARKILAVDI